MAEVLIVASSEAGASLAGFARSAGHVARPLARPEAALAWLRKGPCDLVVIEVGRPDADGLQLIRRIRGRRPQLPILAVAAAGELPAGVSQLLAEVYGADQTMAAPVARTAFAETIATMAPSSRR